jgi:hypothetical protein
MDAGGSAERSLKHDVRPANERWKENPVRGTNGARVAFITGSPSGIGEPIVRALNTEGHHVAPPARRVNRVQHELGRADMFVNNPGVMPLGSFTPDQ